MIRSLTSERDKLAGRVQILERYRDLSKIGEKITADELREWRPDGPAGKMLKLAWDEFPYLSRFQIENISRLFLHFHKNPVTPWSVQAEPREKDEIGDPRAGVISLWPVEGSIRLPYAQAMLTAEALNRLVDKVKNDAVNEGRK